MIRRKAQREPQPNPPILGKAVAQPKKVFAIRAVSLFLPVAALTEHQLTTKQERTRVHALQWVDVPAREHAAC